VFSVCVCVCVCVCVMRSNELLISAAMIGVGLSLLLGILLVGYFLVKNVSIHSSLSLCLSVSLSLSLIKYILSIQSIHCIILLLVDFICDVYWNACSNLPKCEFESSRTERSTR
jgi:hypothetical protein